MIAPLPLLPPRHSEEELWVVVQSGKWSMSVEHFLDALEYFFFVEGADVVQYTEVSPDKFQHPRIRAWCKAGGLHLHHPKRAGANECLTVSRIRFNRLRNSARRLSPLRLKIGRTAPTFMLISCVRGWGRLRIFHTPAHNFGLRAGLWATKVWFSVMDGARDILDGVRGKNTCSADFNVAVDRPLTQNVINSHLEGFEYAGSEDQNPDIGMRLITGMWVKNHKVVKRSRTLKRRPYHDHAPVLTVLGR